MFAGLSRWFLMFKLRCNRLLTVWLDCFLWIDSTVDAFSSFHDEFSILVSPLLLLGLLPSNLLLLLPPSLSLSLRVVWLPCFVHAVHCAQTRALLRNAELALASTNKRTGAVPAGVYPTSTPSIRSVAPGQSPHPIYLFISASSPPMECQIFSERRSFSGGSLIHLISWHPNDRLLERL